MLVKTIALALGLTGAAGMSQFPEFSQQYKQRLGGAVNELSHVVASFDKDAKNEGLTRQDALVQMAAAGGFSARRADSMATIFERHAQLSNDMTALQGAGPFSRVRLIGNMADKDLRGQVWEEFKPALPLTFEGLIFALTGFFGGYWVVATIAMILSSIGMRRSDDEIAAEVS